jgi:hypothetical protein
MPCEGDHGRSRLRRRILGTYRVGFIFRIAVTRGEAASGSLRLKRWSTNSTSRLRLLARDVLHDRDGALAHERDRHGMGAHAVARDAAGGVGGALHGVQPLLDMVKRRNPPKK